MEARLDRALAKAARDRDLRGIVVRVERPGEGLAWSGATGEAAVGTPFFIASTTKLYTSALVLQLVERDVLTLDDRLLDRVDPALVAGLHVRGGVDRTDTITVRHLLAHTSGLPDYFQGRDPAGRSLERELLDSGDRAWTLEEALGRARRQGAIFDPGARGRARYSDTNYQLLGRVIETATGSTYEAALRAGILEPLGLAHTSLYADPADARQLPLRYRDGVLAIPRAMTSFGPDGGIVAPVDELMTFLRAWWEGRLFDPAGLAGLRVYNRIFFPLEAGIGHTRIRLPRIFSPFAAQPVLEGHSGLSGAFAFRAPDRGVYLAGTVNNVARPDRSFRLMYALLAALRG